MTSRRHRGDGSVYKHSRSGLWVCSISDGVTYSGKRRRNVKSFARKSEAESELRKQRSAREQGKLARGQDRTLGAFAEWWFASEGQTAVRESTLSTYRTIYETYIAATFAKRKMRDIEPRDIIDWMASIEAAGKSRNTAKRARGILHLLYQHAVRLDEVPVNVVSKVKAPAFNEASRRKREDPLSIAEARQLLAQVIGTPLDAIVHLGLCLGLRRGEVLGLTWSAIDFMVPELEIRAGLKEVRVFLPTGERKIKRVIDRPKTRNSQRTLPIGEELLGALKRRKASQNEDRLRAGTTWVDNDLVFTNAIGESLWPSNVWNRYKKFLAVNGFRPISFHDLRHTAVHLMLDIEVPLEEVSQTMGHATIAITKDIYGGNVRALSDRGTRKLGDYLSGKDSQSVALPLSLGASSPNSASGRAAFWQGDR